MLIAVTAGTIAAATPGGAGPAPAASPSPSPTASAGPVVAGTLDAHTRARKDGIRLRTRDEAIVRTFTLTYPAGASSGWHEHPGIVLATVESGTVVQRVGCRRYVWQAGQSFTEAAPHNVSNPSTTVSAVLRITQIVPADATALRENVPAPNCRRHPS